MKISFSKRTLRKDKIRPEKGSEKETSKLTKQSWLRQFCWRDGDGSQIREVRCEEVTGVSIDMYFSNFFFLCTGEDMAVVG